MKKRVGSHAQAVKMAFLSFEEQLSLVRSTNVLIGMHGAALTFLPFLADNAVVIELVPVNGMKKFHFQNLAAWSDKGFLLWRNSIAENEKDAMNTLVDPTQFDRLLSKALRKLDSPG
jgi:capsular polysaccharide biosynthesis protein